MTSIEADEDDIYLGLQTVEQFESKLVQFQLQNQYNKSLSILQPPRKLVPRSASMTASQLSTALNSTVQRSRKQTFYRDDLKSPKRRKSLIIDEVQELDLFADKIQQLANKCVLTNDQVRIECQKIAYEFGISVINLQQLPTIPERENAILKAIHRQVLDNLKQWKNKIDQREFARSKSTIEQHKTDQKNNFSQQNLDIFDWIEIHSKFRQLKKRLKFALVEIINDKNNSHNLYQQLTNSPSSKLTDVHYARPDTRAIIDELTNLLKTIKTKSTPTARPKQDSTHQAYQFEKWDEKTEKTFNLKRQDAKGRLGKMISSSSWNQVAMGEFIGTFDKGQQNKLQREQLLVRYENCDPMTEDELLYLVNTSVLLNRCSDKRFIQKAINHLDNDIISDVELCIAENILKTYNSIHKGLSQSRHNFLKAKNDAQYQKNRSHKVFVDEGSKTHQFKQIQMKILKMLRQMKNSNTSTLKPNSEKYRLYKEEFKKGNPLANPLVWKFRDIMMKVLEKNKQERRDKQYKSQISKDKPIFKVKDDVLTINQVKRRTHPSSKLIVKIQSDEIKIKPTPQKDIEGYKLSVKKKEFEQQQSNFKIFYSGGPIRARPFATSYLNMKLDEVSTPRLPHKGQWITPEVELVAINKIKRAMKAFLARVKLMRARNERKMKILQEKESKGFAFFQTINKLRAKPLINLDVEECVKNLKTSIAKRQGTYKEPTVKLAMKKIDYSKIPVPKKMIQLKLKQRKLFLALKVGNIQWCEHSGFIFDEYDVNCYDIDRYCPLYYAAKLQSVQFCQFLLSNGADVNMPCKGNTSPTFAAFESNNIEIINLFIENKANLDQLNDEGKNPLCYCSVKLLRELNLQHCSIQGQVQVARNTSIINRRGQSMGEMEYPEYANMQMDAIEDPKEEIIWNNQQMAALRTFYPQGEREKLKQQKEQQMMERYKKEKLLQNTKK